MKRLLVLVSLLIAQSSWAFEILAIGTSNTNCKFSWRSEAYPAVLENLLKDDSINAKVINAGVDGDRPENMIHRLSINKNTKLVIFEPGPNEKDREKNVLDSEKILSKLQELKIPTIYVSHGQIQNDFDAKATADKYGAYYYGRWNNFVPQEHRYSDGHLKSEGCRIWGKMMHPFVKDVLVKENIK